MSWGIGIAFAGSAGAFGLVLWVAYQWSARREAERIERAAEANEDLERVEAWGAEGRTR